MSNSEVSIYNRALGFLGGDQLSSVEAPWEDSSLGRLCRNLFPAVLRGALEQHSWSFATARAYLAQKVGEEPGHPQYRFRYGLPADLVRVVRVYGPGGGEELHTREGGHILTNAWPATLLYVREETDPSLWPPAFAEALAWKLAGELASGRLNNSGKQAECFKNYLVCLEAARANDQNSLNPARPRSRWLAGHQAYDGGDW